MTAGRGIVGLLLAIMVLAGLGALTAAATPHPGTQQRMVSGSTVDFVNISATSALSFDPSSVTVTPGASVHLEVTQASDFLHTFLLAPQANYTLPTSSNTTQLIAYFAVHHPIVNLSLGTTPGAIFSANFTAPPPGSYEYICIVPGHFAAGMHGTLVSGSSSSGGLAITTAVTVVAVVVILAALVAFLLVRRRRSSRPLEAPPPAAPPPVNPPRT